MCCGLIRSEAFQANPRQVDLMNKKNGITIEFKNIQRHHIKLNMHLIDRIPEYEYAKVLLQISCTMIFGLLLIVATYMNIFISSRFLAIAKQ